MPFALIKRPNFKAIFGRVLTAEEQWLEDLGQFIVDAHLELTANWSSQPKFTLRKGEIFEVTTSDANWIRVNYGTGLRGPKKKAYTIPKSPGGLLRFLPKYIPKTTRTKHGGLGKSSGIPVYTKKVTAKGIRPRRFDSRVTKEAKKEFYPKWSKIIQTAITRR